MKLLSFILSLVVASTGTQAFSQTAILSLPTVTATPGEADTISINATNFTNVAGIDITIKFLASSLSFTGVTNTTGPVTFTPTSTDTSLRLFWVDVSGQNPANITSGKLTDIIFNYAGGTSPLEFDTENSLVGDPAGSPITVEYQNGSISPPVPDIAVETTSHDYAKVNTDSSASHTFVVTNEGAAELTVEAPTLEGTNADEFNIDSGGTSFTLTPEQTHEVVVSFAPTSIGTKSATLRFTSNDPDENPFDVNLMGEGEPPVSVDDIVHLLPKDFKLEQNYPNPFNPETKIVYQLPNTSKITLRIYNLLGQKVRTLIDDVRPVGRYEITWDGKDNLGKRVAGGIYLAKFQAGSFVQTRKMLYSP